MSNSIIQLTKCLLLLLFLAFCSCADAPAPTNTRQSDDGPAQFVLRVESTDDAELGSQVEVAIVVESALSRIDGFDLLLGFDSASIRLLEVVPGAIADCQWDYFTYRPADTIAVSGSPAGGVRVVGVADLNNGQDYDPTCMDSLSQPFVLATLRFQVTDDPRYLCTWVPIRFLWSDCSDNLISSSDNSGEWVHSISRHVTDRDQDGDEERLDDSFSGFPTFSGAGDCLAGLPGVELTVREVDFINGGVAIKCPEAGDVNLNGQANEIADAVLFSNYLVYGASALGDRPRNVCAMASDVNSDGVPWAIEDLVYIIRIIIGDAQPYPKVVPPVTWPSDALRISNGGVIEVDQSIGAMLLVVTGRVVPTLLDTQLEMDYSFDETANATRVLLSSLNGDASGVGGLVEVDSPIERLNMATPEGNRIDVEGWLDGLPPQ